MKKLLVTCLMMVMALSMSITAFANPGSFVSSPSGNPAPTVVEFKPSNADCTAQLVVTPYGERQTLPDDLRSIIEKAYDDIVNTDDLTKLNSSLAEVAENKNVDGTKLAVSDLFDIHLVGCDNQDGHTGFDVTLKADTLKSFVGLLCMNNDGEWELVTNAEVINNDEYLKFSVDCFSSFAIVVETGVPTGDNSLVYVYAILMVISAVAFVVILTKTKKQSA